MPAGEVRIGEDPSATIAAAPAAEKARIASARTLPSFQKGVASQPNISATICTRANLAQYRREAEPDDAHLAARPNPDTVKC